MLTQREIIDKLLKGLYSIDEPFEIDGFKDVALQMALTTDGNLLKRAHELLDDGVKLIKVNGSGELVVLIQNHLVDIDQWFCSCKGFVRQFDQSATSTATTPTDAGVDYGKRSKCQFQITLTNEDGIVKEDKIPICEHLLAVHLYKLHPRKFDNVSVIEQTQCEILREAEKLI